ncbi:hypothetical protein ACQP25_17360 [Microtetraspora malaysiensis]|uniref:hypothetical protein n=1 Tax=Microtetraspora malaysiensis TaxID=161358 RepID=UPI003D91A3CC
MTRVDAYLAVVQELPAQTAQTDRYPAITAARRLQRALRLRHKVLADDHQGHGVAFLSVGPDLVVWTNGLWFQWYTGKRDERGRRLYARGPATDPVTAADRVATRYVEIMKEQPPQDPVPDSMRNPI